jgi:hypothetical protein
MCASSQRKTPPQRGFGSNNTRRNEPCRGTLHGSPPVSVAARSHSLAKLCHQRPIGHGLDEPRRLRPLNLFTSSGCRPNPVGSQARRRRLRRRRERVQSEDTRYRRQLWYQEHPAPGQGSRPRRGDGGRPFEGQLPGSCRSPGRTPRATASPRSARPGSSATTARRGWRQAARSSARPPCASARAQRWQPAASR